MRRLLALGFALSAAAGAVLGWLSYDESAPEERAQAMTGSSSKGDIA